MAISCTTHSLTLVPCRAAAEAKVLRPRPKVMRPFEDTPKLPDGNSRLSYWASQEGLEARQSDVRLRDAATSPSAAVVAAAGRKALPARPAVPAATPGRLGLPGVYLSSRRELAEPEARAGLAPGP
jgi:hypothetical protein